jgi:hypothetical protein
MAVFQGEVGLQFTTHIANRHTVPEWVQLAQLAYRYKFRAKLGPDYEEAIRTLARDLLPSIAQR